MHEYCQALLDSCRPLYAGSDATLTERVLHIVKSAIDSAAAPKQPIGVGDLAFPSLRAAVALCPGTRVQLVFHRPESVTSFPPKSADSQQCPEAGARPPRLHGTPHKIAARIDLVGSYLLRSLARPCLNVDLAVTMPGVCLSRKDYLNHRYTAKRAMYLGVVSTAVLQAFGLCGEGRKISSDGNSGHGTEHVARDHSGAPVVTASIAAFRGDVSKPVLVLHVRGRVQQNACSVLANAAQNFTVRIFPCIAADSFPPSKLLHLRNNVRVQFPCRVPYYAPATPRYTNGILEDMCFSRHLRVLHTAARKCSAFSDCCMLLKIWLRRRFGMAGESPDTFNGFLLSMILAHVIESEEIVNRQMSPLQLFRGTLQFLADIDLTSNPQVRN